MLEIKIGKGLTLFCQQNIQVYIHVLAVMVFTIYKDEEIEKKNIKEMCE